MTASRADLFDKLRSLGIETTTLKHPPVFTVEEARAHYAHLPGGHCKSLFLKDKKDRLYLLVALDSRPIELNAIGKTIGSARLSFGRPDLLMAVLGVSPGSVTPFALINDRERQVTVVLDAGMMRETVLNYHPLTNEATTAIRPADLRRFIAACGHLPTELEL
ncbi:MAG: prolyl-tRNA synthetase associated domain-containing protein [Alphaproteobacteria bacterium]|nr:prolyl-tRNA synthetase associated domain-containing protein [Alphaproteobacteria bacterium]